MSKVFFTSDTHFGHRNVLLFNPNRTVFGPDIEQMNQGLIDRWNSVVSNSDFVYHLGDFSMGAPKVLVDALRCLQGHIIIVRGNHDRSIKHLMRSGFEEAHKELSLTVLDGENNPHKVFLKHKPPYNRQDWQTETGCEWYLHGHIHELYARRDKLINVGVDVSDYYPLTFQQLLDRPYPGAYDAKKV